MSRRRRLAALAAPAALFLGACASNDATRGDVVDAMTDTDLEQPQADCIGDRFEDQFDQDQLNEIGSADDPDDYPEELRPEIEQILEECIEGDASTGTTGDTTGEGTTEDTQAGG